MPLRHAQLPVHGRGRVGRRLLPISCVVNANIPGFNATEGDQIINSTPPSLRLELVCIDTDRLGRRRDNFRLRQWLHPEWVPCVDFRLLCRRQS